MGGADGPFIGNIFGANDAYVNNDLNGVMLNGIGAGMFGVRLPATVKVPSSAGIMGLKSLNSAYGPNAVDKQHK
jgi:hypothetical protein